MANRLDLQAELEKVLANENVYFQPPATLNMKYPCVRYSKSEKNVIRANNKVYRGVNRYDGVVMDRNPDSTIPDDILSRFQMCSLGKPYVVNNLNHFPFTIYY